VKRIHFSRLFYLGFILCLLSVKVSQAQTFTNPLVKSQTAPDPWMIYKDGYYYFTSTGGGHIAVWKSPTITGIDNGKKVTVWKAPPTGPNSRNVWAPELHFLNGRWYIYYAADDGPNAHHRLYVLESVSNDAQGLYVDKGKIAVPGEDKWAIDATVLARPDGSLYLIWSGWPGDEDRKQCIYIAPMSNPWTISGPRVLLSTPELPWEGRINEGPEVLQRGGKTFIVYSANGSWLPDYCLGMLTNSDGNVLNASSWTKSPAPVFATYSGPAGTLYAPGHNSFTRSPDGREDWIIYHGKDTDKGGWANRMTRAQKFTWNADGTPNFGHPVPSGVSLPVPSGELAVQMAPSIHLQADRTAVGMGQTVRVLATATRGGRAAAGLELWPYVNSRRWGTQATTDAQGHATFLLPLPNVGRARIQAIVRPPKPSSNAFWIWANTPQDNQTLYLTKTFFVTAPVRAASLHITGDDMFHAYLNGHDIGEGGGWEKVKFITNLAQWLKPGENTLAVETHNASGPAGLLARLEITTPQGQQVIATDRTWQIFDTQPTGWPNNATAPGRSASQVAPVGEGAWGSGLEGWPGLSPQNDFPVGTPLPQGASTSNPLSIRVHRRTINNVRDPEHLVGMEWEPWFTPRNARWDTAEAVPLVGNYDSFNTDAIRQHALWMTEAGVNFLLVDWSNNLWGKEHWSERAPGVNELMRGTTLLLDTYAQMRKEGIPVPQITLLLGLDNGPTTTMTALNEELQWVYDNYVRNPRYQGLWLYYEGKPLIVPFDGGGQAYKATNPAIDSSRFTIRWMSTRFEVNHAERNGYWSWMDGVVHPIPTYHNGQAEALTVTPAFFGDGGWTYPQAMGRRGGATYLEEFKTALQHRPRFLLLNQWNEFAGQAEGTGYGPNKDQYVDTYNVELSDDIEPTSLTACSYRGCGGWGFYYQNLTRALVEIYHGLAPETTLLSIAHPLHEQVVTGETLPVEWNTIGKAAQSFTLSVDGQVVARGLQGSNYALPLKNLAPGAHTLILRAEGVTTQFPLSSIQQDEPLKRPVPVWAQVDFEVANYHH